MVLVSLAIRCLQMGALKVASGAQAATGPTIANGNPHQYFVYMHATASPGLGSVLGNWDGQWYMRIADVGYARADQVQSANDAWVSAFPPGFPMLARATMWVTGLPFTWAAFVLNTVLTLIAAVLLYEVLRSSGLATRVAVVAGIGVSLLPSSPVLMTAYSEALALALVLLALRLLLVHRYLLVSAAIVGLAFTRPVAIAFVPVVLVHAAMRWQAGRKSVPLSEWAGMGVVVVVSALSPWVWPWAAARLYGVPNGVQAVGSGRTGQIISQFSWGYLGSAWAASGLRGLTLVLLCALVLIGVPTLLGLQIGWPGELLAWGAAYVAMVILVTPTTPGFLRYLVLAAPLIVVLIAAPLARPSPGKTILLVVLVGAGLWGQWLWIRYLFILDPAPYLGPWAP